MMSKEDFVKEVNAMSDKAKHKFNEEELIFFEKDLRNLALEATGEVFDFNIDSYGRMSL